MAFDSQVRCDIETLNVTINNYERMENAPEAWARIKKLVEEKLKSPNKTHSEMALELTKVSRSIRNVDGFMARGQCLEILNAVIAQLHNA